MSTVRLSARNPQGPCKSVQGASSYQWTALRGFLRSVQDLRGLKMERSIRCACVSPTSPLSVVQVLTMTCHSHHTCRKRMTMSIFTLIDSTSALQPWYSVQAIFVPFTGLTTSMDTVQHHLIYVISTCIYECFKYTYNGAFHFHEHAFKVPAWASREVQDSPALP